MLLGWVDTALRLEEENQAMRQLLAALLVQIALERELWRIALAELEKADL